MERVNTDLLMLRNCRPIVCIPCPESGCCELSTVMWCLRQCVHCKSSLLVHVEMMLVNVQEQRLVFRHHSLIRPLAVANATPNFAGKPDSGKDAEVRLWTSFSSLCIARCRFPPITAAGLVAPVGSFRVFLSQGKRRGEECNGYITAASWLI